MMTTTLRKPPASVREAPQDAGLLVVGTLAVLFVLNLPALPIGG